MKRDDDLSLNDLGMMQTSANVQYADEDLLAVTYLDGKDGTVRVSDECRAAAKRILERKFYADDYSSLCISFMGITPAIFKHIGLASIKKFIFQSVENADGVRMMENFSILISSAEFALSKFELTKIQELFEEGGFSGAVLRCAKRIEALDAQRN